MLWAAQLHAFAHGIAIDDAVVMPAQDGAAYAVGSVTGYYAPLCERAPALRHVRPVAWQRTALPRAAVPSDLHRALETSLRVCRIAHHDAAARVWAVATGGADPGYDGVPEALVSELPVGG